MVAVASLTGRMKIVVASEAKTQLTVNTGRTGRADALTITGSISIVIGYL